MINERNEVVALYERLHLLRLDYFKAKNELVKLASAGCQWTNAADDLTDLEWLIKSIEAILYGRSFSSLYFTKDTQPVDELDRYEDMIARGRYGRGDHNKRMACKLTSYLGFSMDHLKKGIEIKKYQILCESEPI